MEQCERHDAMLDAVLKASGAMESVAAKTTEMHEALIGTYDKEGLIGKVNRHERSLGGIWRFSWLILGAFVVLVMGSIWAAI